MIHRFNDFELDTGLFELRRRNEAVAMEPQVFTVLAYLVEHRDRVVTKHELIDHVWGDRFVSEAALTSRLMAARKALGDSGQAQRYIKTVHGRGYRFVGEVVADDAAVMAPVGSLPVADHVPFVPAAAPGVFGRERELAHLHEWLAIARGGTRSVVFITGEAGSGKSTLIDAFLSSLPPTGARIATGRCVEQRGVGEPYMPVIEALSRLVESGGPAVFSTMMRRAPAWLLQVPWLLSDEDIVLLRERALGNTSERMLREAAEAIEELAQETPLVLVLEDVHWADRSTLDLVNWIARRNQPARLLLLASYRPAAAEEGGVAALQPDLRVRGLCSELKLPFLDGAALQVYLQSQFPGLAELPDLSQVLLRRTDGNPLFLRAIVEDWRAKGALRQDDGGWRMAVAIHDLQSAVPDNLRGLITGQIARLTSADRELLEIAAVAGSPFTSAAVAAAMDRPVEEVERSCESMCGSAGMLRPSSESRAWPLQVAAGSYAFVHALYEETVYGAIPPARRSRIHQKMGDAIESASGEDADSFATDLARHFRLAGDGARAVRYLGAAAEQAMFRGAHREGAGHLRSALELLPAIADPVARVAREAEIQSLLADATVATQGFGALDAERAYKRALELTGGADQRAGHAGALFGLAALLEFQAKHAEADALLQQIESAGIDDRLVRIPYHALRSCSAFHRGSFSDAIGHGEEGIRLQRPGDAYTSSAFLGEDPLLVCREWSGLSLWFIGYPDSALRRMDELLDLAATLNRRFAYASALSQATRLHQMRLEPDRARERAEEAIAVAEEYGFTYYVASSKTVLGWALVALGEVKPGLEALREGLDLHHGTGAQMDRPYYLGLLADALLRSGAPGDASQAIDEALGVIAGSGSPFFYEPELRRLQAEVFRAMGDLKRAEGSVLEALRLANGQQARSLELRSAVTLAEIRLGRGDAAGSDTRLAGILSGFTEGHQTADYLRARRVLDALAAAPSPKNRGRRRK